jgi:hypothetical protein
MNPYLVALISGLAIGGGISALIYWFRHRPVRLEPDWEQAKMVEQKP